jgi:hypothetical protein
MWSKFQSSAFSRASAFSGWRTAESPYDHSYGRSIAPVDSPQSASSLHDAGLPKDLGSDPSPGAPDDSVVAQTRTQSNPAPRPAPPPSEFQQYNGNKERSRTESSQLGAYQNEGVSVNDMAGSDRPWNALADSECSARQAASPLVYFSHPLPSPSYVEGVNNPEQPQMQRRRSLDSFQALQAPAERAPDPEERKPRNSQERSLFRSLMAAAASNTLSIICAAEQNGLRILDLVGEWCPEDGGGEVVESTLLMVAAELGSVDVVHYLLKQGADPNRRVSSNPATALICAVRGRSPECHEVVRLLVCYGAHMSVNHHLVKAEAAAAAAREPLPTQDEAFEQQTSAAAGVW